MLTYHLAGPATRLMAYLVDLLLRMLVLLILSCVLSILAIGLPGASIGLLFLVWFVMEWGYFVLCEGFFRGKTIGKHVFGLRVIHELGHPMTFWSAMLRNVLRAADAIPLYGIGLAAMLCSRRFQRLGDLLARTIVIHERPVRLPQQPIILERIQPLARDEIGAWSPDEETLSLIDQFLGRRYVLTHARGHALAWILARVLAQRLGYRGSRELVERYPMAFLARVHVTFIHRRDEEQDLRLGTTGAERLPVEAVT